MTHAAFSSPPTRNADAVAALVRPDQFHADVYLSADIFALEQERLFARTWQYVGHASQIPTVGDFFTTDIAGQPLLMLRQPDGSVRVLINRCAHKGTALLTQRCGNTASYCAALPRLDVQTGRLAAVHAAAQRV